MPYYLGFDFYGAGNIGDDLMLAGLLDTFRGTQPIEGIAHDPASQQRRFPSVKWFPLAGESKETLIGRASAWLGVGDTPFQLTSGSWFLDALEAALSRAKSCNLPVAMLAVGAEREVLTAKPLIEKFIDRIDAIWTRDQMSTDILLALEVDPARVATAADLAHIWLSRMPQSQGERPYSLGIGYYSEGATHAEISALADFIRTTKKNSPLCYISNEFRTCFEFATYTRILTEPIGKQRLFRRPYINYSNKIGETMPIFIPDYLAGTVADFVLPYAKCETVLSSRYHGILAAAWSGCRVGILGGRSSKLDSLAAQFDIPMLRPPYTAVALSKLNEAATRVPRQRLEAEADKAIGAVRAVERWLGSVTVDTDPVPLKSGPRIAVA